MMMLSVGVVCWTRFVCCELRKLCYSISTTSCFLKLFKILFILSICLWIRFLTCDPFDERFVNSSFFAWTLLLIFSSCDRIDDFLSVDGVELFDWFEFKFKFLPWPRVPRVPMKCCWRSKNRSWLCSRRSCTFFCNRKCQSVFLLYSLCKCRISCVQMQLLIRATKCQNVAFQLAFTLSSSQREIPLLVLATCWYCIKGGMVGERCRVVFDWCDVGSVRGGVACGVACALLWFPFLWL